MATKKKKSNKETLAQSTATAKTFAGIATSFSASSSPKLKSLAKRSGKVRDESMKKAGKAFKAKLSEKFKGTR